MRLLILAAALASTLPSAAIAAPAASWEAAVASALGRSGTEMPGGVYRVGLPRSDLHVVVDGVTLKAGFALGGWLAFASHGSGNDVMVMGDLVLTDEEVAPVMRRLLRGGLEVTALHNHLLRESPHIMYMHVGGHGDAAAVGATIREALATSHIPPAGPPAPAGSTPPPLGFDVAAVEHALGRPGKNNNGVFAFTFPRAPRPTMGGMTIADAMGGATGINFQPTQGGRAAITGDFVLTASEVEPVMRALATHGIEVTALHSHMIEEQPRLFFMHFWAEGEAPVLAAGLADALSHVATARP